jgi:MoaA/NifB/PqqE/SkfB family radical SAM enzyme
MMDIGLKPRFRFALILLTNRCNLVCKHCYVESGPRGHWGLDLERLYRLTDELYEQYGRMFVSVSGGEALVRESDCLALLERARSKHEVQLVSNGTLITRPIAEGLTNLGVAVKISIDGASAKEHDWMRGKGSFAKTLKGIDALMDAGMPASRLALGATIPSSRVEQIDEILELASSLGIGKVRLDSVAKIGRARHYWPHANRAAPDSDSRAIRTYFEEVFEGQHGSEWRLLDLNENVGMFETLHIYFDGEVHLYLNYDHPITKEGRVGNINESSLKAIVDGDRVGDAILRHFLKFSRCPERSYISYYALRRAQEARVWFEKSATSYA